MGDEEMDVDMGARGGGTTEDDELSSYHAPTYPRLPTVDLEDWQYVMRRTMQEIIPGLFLGIQNI